MSDLLNQLNESLLLVRLRQLSKQLENLQGQQRAGNLGPRVVRARVRIMQRERRSLVRLAQECGYPVEE